MEFDLVGTRLRMESKMAVRTGSTDVWHGALRGTIAAMSMSGFRTLSTAIGVVKETPPEMVTDERAPRGLRKLPESKYQAAIVMMHWLYGAGGGAAFGALPSAWRRRAWAGPLWGTVLWAGFEAVLEPAVGIHMRRSRPAKERIALAVDHVLYGMVLSEMRRRPAH